MRRFMVLAAWMAACGCVSADEQDEQDDAICLTEDWAEHDECCQVEGSVDIVCRQGRTDAQGMCQVEEAEHSRATRQCAEWADTGGSYIWTGQTLACEAELAEGFDCCLCEWEPDAECRPCSFLD